MTSERPGMLQQEEEAAATPEAAPPADGRLARIAEAYRRSIEALAVTSIAALVVVAALQVFFRYIVGQSLTWSEELMRYLMVWTAFLTVGLAYGRGEMLGMSILIDALPPRLRLVLSLFARTAVLSFLLVVVWYGAIFAWRTRFSSASTLPLSMLWVHISVAVGFALLAGHVIIDALLLCRPKENPKEEQS